MWYWPVLLSVVLAFTPACGKCVPCARGLQNLCDKGAELMTGRAIADGTYRISLDGVPMLPMGVIYDTAVRFRGDDVRCVRLTWVRFVHRQLTSRSDL